MAAQRLHLARYSGSVPGLACGAPIRDETRWTAVRSYFHHPKYQPDMERCANCKRADGEVTS